MSTRTVLLAMALLAGVMLMSFAGGAGGHKGQRGPVGVRATDAGPSTQGLDYSLKPCDQEFAQFHVGRSFQGHELTDHTRFCTQPDPERSLAAGGGIDPDSLGRSNFDSYLYGTCEAGPGEACAPPLEIQSWPACERSPADYNGGPPGHAKRIEPIEASRVRGVPARFYEDMRLELSIKGVTVVVWGHSKDQLVAAAQALRTEPHAPFEAGPKQQLPPPMAGAEEGTLSC